MSKFDEDDIWEFANLQRLSDAGESLSEADKRRLKYYNANASMGDAMRAAHQTRLQQLNRDSIMPSKYDVASMLLANVPKIAGGVAAGAASIVGSTLGKVIDSQFLNPHMEGLIITNYNSNSSEYNAGRYPCAFSICKPSEADLKSLDAFFSAYGQRVDDFDNPQKCFGYNSPAGDFSFIKTRGAVVKSTNANAARQMQEMMDNGCAFWHSEIGG